MNIDTAAALPTPQTAHFLSAPVILLVEDDPAVRDIARQVLEHAGYHVVHCTNGQQALHAVANLRSNVGLLLTDLVMPGMNGIELAKRLHAEQPNLATVFMSGHADTGMISGLLGYYLQKPFTINDLLSRIEQALTTAHICLERSPRSDQIAS
jgi:CheY-like chemotaxis protein